MSAMSVMRSLVALVGLLAVDAVANAEPANEAHAAAPARKPVRWYVRAGAALVKPMASSHEIELADVSGPASLAVDDGPIAGSGARVESAMIPAAIVGYVLPTASRRWSLETVLGTPFTVKFRATGTLANMSIAPSALGIPTKIAPLGPELGEATALPPLITAVYQLTDRGAVRPFVGAGVSVLFAYDAHVTNPQLVQYGKPDMTIAPAPGIVLQGGLDARIYKSVYARLDVKFIGLMMARAEVHHLTVATPGLPVFEAVEVETAKMNVWVNPFIVQAAIGIDL